ncbi:MAG: hypothetical protein A2Y38_24360 [Spirochaetes bacterium GWB1_59_5]|nr:MAG: hypothetical protein A2Y38_24360 [Spirochaetes bacterium GWB1_59_5]
MDQYHPKRKRNEIISEGEKTALLKAGNHVTIALCDNNIPYIVTMSYGLDAECNVLYFHCANKGDKLDFIRKNANACATLIKDNGYLETRCDHDYESLVIRGAMCIVDELAEKKHGLQIILNHLEKDPQPIFDRNIKDDHSYDGVTIIKMSIDSSIGKKYMG